MKTNEGSVLSLCHFLLHPVLMSLSKFHLSTELYYKGTGDLELLFSEYADEDCWGQKQHKGVTEAMCDSETFELHGWIALMGWQQFIGQKITHLEDKKISFQVGVGDVVWCLQWKWLYELFRRISLWDLKEFRQLELFLIQIPSSHFHYYHPLTSHPEGCNASQLVTCFSPLLLWSIPTWMSTYLLSHIPQYFIWACSSAAQWNIHSF